MVGNFSDTFQISHPVVTHKLDLLRDKKTRSWDFRKILHELSGILVYEALRDIKPVSELTEIWSGQYQRKKIPSTSVVFVSILRAGIGMLEGALDIFPKASVCFIGVKRNEIDASPNFYYKNIISDINTRTAVIIDPMLATGGSILYTLDILKKSGCNSVKIVSILSAPEGIHNIREKYPTVPIYTGSIDEKLDKNSFIIPGLGDAGDRCFDTVPK